MSVRGNIMYAVASAACAAVGAYGAVVISGWWALPYGACGGLGFLLACGFAHRAVERREKWLATEVAERAEAQDRT